MLEIKEQRPNQLTWKERHPSTYSFKKINIAQFLNSKQTSKTRKNEKIARISK